MKKYKGAIAAVLGTFMAIGQAQAQQAESLQALLNAVEQGAVRDQQAHQERLEEFRSDRAEQQQLLEQARADLAAAEARSTELENTFDENQLLIEDVRAQLRERLGSLNELFGVLQQVAGDARSQFRNSLTHVQFPERTQFLADLARKLGESDQLPEISEIERLWFELQREATELGQVQRLTNQRYITADGQEVTGDVVRVGAFNLVTDGAYLQFDADTNTISEYQRQPPEGRFVNSTSALVAAQPGDGLVRFGVDVTGGVVLGNLIDTATWQETIEYGGTPGYVIIALGIIGILLSIERLITLGIAGAKVRAQLKRETPDKGNALGRVLSVYHENQNVDTETLELKLSEAILKETPSLQRGILFIKIISVVAPLLGLLGTVVGMIQTFQAITLFGTGDPTIMAGGISQALVTTQFGLMVAIPTVLLHKVVNGRSRAIIQVLQEQSAGIVARHAERTH